MAPGIAEKKNNSLPLWGNEKTMNLNNLVLTNILSSHYFKVNLYQLKTYHEVIDEIYYQVTHLEPWEKGSRKTSGQTGMCGGVRGVGAGGIVSTAFCILYKLFTLKLTRKQVVGLINHADSPYIRALGFMYIRYTQPPADLWDWYENYLTDPEELDVKAGGGQMMRIGEMLRHYLSKLEWFSTLFPRIPVPIQKDLEKKLANWRARPENKALIENSAGWNGETEPQRTTEDWENNVPAKSSHKGGHSGDAYSKEHVSESKECQEKDFSEELAKEKERQRRDRDGHPSSSSRHRSSEAYGRHRDRSRSPRRHGDHKSSRDNDAKISKRKHHDRSRDNSSERNRHRSTKVKKHIDESSEGRHSKDRNHQDRKQERSHKHEHSKHHKKHSHSSNQDHH